MFKLKGLTLYFVLCVATAVLAKLRGRSGAWWFIVALAITPVLASALLVVMSRGAQPAGPLP